MGVSFAHSFKMKTAKCGDVGVVSLWVKCSENGVKRMERKRGGRGRSRMNAIDAEEKIFKFQKKTHSISVSPSSTSTEG